VYVRKEMRFELSNRTEISVYFYECRCKRYQFLKNVTNFYLPINDKFVLIFFSDNALWLLYQTSRFDYTGNNDYR